MSNDGGPAFPACNEANVNDTMGMTLRDYFAGQALVAIIGGDHPRGWNHRDTAGQAYRYADAMLAEREKANE